MMIDDDDDALEIYHLLIERSSCAEHFHTFNSGYKAFDFLDHCIQEKIGFPRYILLDLNMPDIGGIEFVEQYEAKYAGAGYPTEIIMLTSSVKEQDNEQALSYRTVTHLISKPLSKDDLISMLQKSTES